ncbi:hypothetical protein Y032_0025g1275 [Ancylostoma ceylanicum]|uniref:Uncharacterized protein n=1 Tax=Ancylostoma ceylanicum TaxID=53326 RepID=A0A016UWW4_9BILA|nr:hypothetical protein Y032_0025g1275 [Ancylostoma ceylanicum]
MFRKSMLHTSHFDVYKLLLALIILEIMGVSKRRSMTAGCWRLGFEEVESGALELTELFDGCSADGERAARLGGSELSPGDESLETLA